MTDRADLAEKLAALTATEIDDLRKLWRQLYRSHPPPAVGRELLILVVAWKLQKQVLGGLSPAMKRRIADLDVTMKAKGDLAKARMIQPRSGARLMRVWQGRTHSVLVLDDGFEWQGERHASLSAIARKITGTRWSGPRFFGLDKPVKEAADG